MSAQLTICVLACEFPFDPSSRSVALLLPLSDFCLKQLRRGDALSGALPIHNPDFDLRHVQPTGVLGGVVELDALQKRRCCLRFKIGSRPICICATGCTCSDASHMRGSRR